MKNRFSTLDLRASIAELQKKYQGMRVMNVYDVDKKTYLIKLAKPELKVTILLESGIRIHSTEFEWPKHMTPSGFSMKLRKHLRSRRLESISQLGIDRIIDLQFGCNEAAYHVILELYDRGNIVLTDHEYMILNILRPRTDESEDVRFAVYQKYPVESAKQHEGLITSEKLMSVLLAAKKGDNLKKVLNPHLVYGASLIEHALLHVGIPSNARVETEFIIAEHMDKLLAALEYAEHLLESSMNGCKGYITQKLEKAASVSMETGIDTQELLTYSEFHPYLFKQHEKQQFVEFESFDKAVDEFFSNIGSQKLDMKALQQERVALKKLDHIKKDHLKRLDGLQQEQDVDMNKAKLVEINLDLVDRAIVVVQSAIANQIDWDEIHTIVKEAQLQGDPVASSIKSLKLDTNHMIMRLQDVYVDSDDDEEVVTSLMVDIDLGLTAYANARKYFDKKRKAAFKEQKTIDASTKALKSAERKTMQTLKDVQIVASINKARKTYWFEKFLWFISSENYVVIGGRDQQQNEHIVKKYLRPGDVYVHADLHGASSVIIKNPKQESIPPKTLNEAGTMALCNSAAWDARVVTSAWWVHHHQVSKTAPTGEYLTTGSFMIRGKKNYLPPSYLIYGFGFMFKVDEDSLFRHEGERRVRAIDDDIQSTPEHTDPTTNSEHTSGDASSDGHDNEDDNDDDASSTQQTDSDDITTDDDTDDEDEIVKEEIDENVEDEIVKDEVENVNDEKVKDEEENVKDEVNTEVKDDEENNDDVDIFPDTNIGVQYGQGGKLRVEASRVASTSVPSVHTGNDANPTQCPAKTTARLSAKQRRELKKKKTRETGLPEGTEIDTLDTQPLVPEDDVQQNKQNRDESGKNAAKQTKIQPAEAPSEPVVNKRRLKNKLKKMREKYGDQDEEERKLRMEILASAGAPKEDKKKGRKNKQQARQQAALQQKITNMAKGGIDKFHPQRKLTVDDIREDAPTIAHGELGASVEVDDVDSDEEKQALLGAENIQTAQDVNELDSLTGLPVLEDILHFCVPVCAPYSAILNYKYKVKLTPGATRRGKAAKTALHGFLHDKTTTSREKDLLKSLKDIDVSRNIPGKVKVSGPNLLKQKKK